MCDHKIPYHSSSSNALSAAAICSIVDGLDEDEIVQQMPQPPLIWNIGPSFNIDRMNGQSSAFQGIMTNPNRGRARRRVSEETEDDQVSRGMTNDMSFSRQRAKDVEHCWI